MAGLSRQIAFPKIIDQIGIFFKKSSRSNQTLALIEIHKKIKTCYLLPPPPLLIVGTAGGGIPTVGPGTGAGGIGTLPPVININECL